jgi:hypothetical protein
VKRKAPRRPHIPTVVKRRLRTNWATADNKSLEISIDACLTGRAAIEAMIHEWLHLDSWALPEEEVRRISRDLTALLHANNVRVIEPGNQPLDLDKETK